MPRKRKVCSEEIERLKKEIADCEEKIDKYQQKIKKIKNDKKN